MSEGHMLQSKVTRGSRIGRGWWEWRMPPCTQSHMEKELWGRKVTWVTLTSWYDLHKQIIVLVLMISMWAVLVTLWELGWGPCQNGAKLSVPLYPAKVNVKDPREEQPLLDGLKTLNNQIFRWIERRFFKILLKVM